MATRCASDICAPAALFEDAHSLAPQRCDARQSALQWCRKLASVCGTLRALEPRCAWRVVERAAPTRRSFGIPCVAQENESYVTFLQSCVTFWNSSFTRLHGLSHDHDAARGNQYQTSESMLYPRSVSKRVALLDDVRPPAPQRWRSFGVSSLTTTTQHVVTHSGSAHLCYTRRAIVRPPPSLKMRTHLHRGGTLLPNLLHRDGVN